MKKSVFLTAIFLILSLFFCNLNLAYADVNNEIIDSASISHLNTSGGHEFSISEKVRVEYQWSLKG